MSTDSNKLIDDLACPKACVAEAESRKCTNAGQGHA